MKRNSAKMAYKSASQTIRGAYNDAHGECGDTADLIIDNAFYDAKTNLECAVWLGRILPKTADRIRQIFGI